MSTPSAWRKAPQLSVEEGFEGAKDLLPRAGCLGAPLATFDARLGAAALRELRDG